MLDIREMNFACHSGEQPISTGLTFILSVISQEADQIPSLIVQPVGNCVTLSIHGFWLLTQQNSAYSLFPLKEHRLVQPYYRQAEH